MEHGSQFLLLLIVKPALNCEEFDLCDPLFKDHVILDRQFLACENMCLRKKIWCILWILVIWVCKYSSDAKFVEDLCGIILVKVVLDISHVGFSYCEQKWQTVTVELWILENLVIS